MNSTTARARLLTALLLLAGSFSVVLVAQGATAAPGYRVNLTVSDTRPDVGETLRLSGKVTPAAPGKRVRVQGKVAGTGWVTITKVRLSKASTYRTAFRLPAAGRLSIRIVKSRSRTVARGISRTRNIRVGEGSTAPVLLAASLPAAAVGSAYSATIRTADDRPGEFRVGAGSLPPGLSLHDQTGVISGSPTTQGTFSFTVAFRDPDGLSDTETYAITVGSTAPPVISTTTLPAGSVNARYEAKLETTGNAAGTWAVTTGALPAGLILAPATGVISGTPTTAGTKSFTVRFTQTGTGLTDTQPLSIAIGAATAPVISTTSLPAGIVGKAYSATLQTVGNKTGTWAVTTGALPAGLTLATATGVISGTPTTAGTSSFTVRFTQTGGLTDTQALSLKVDPSSPPVITTTSLPGGTVGVAYSRTLQTDGNRTGTWSVSSGALPPGLTLAPSTGVVSGTPSAVGTSSFTVLFTALNGLTDTQALSITIDTATPPVISTTTLPDGTVGTAYSQTLQTEGNRSGTWSLSGGSLPPGLNLAGATGVISGTPTTAGTSTFTVLFTAAGGLTDSQGLSITVVAPSP